MFPKGLIKDRFRNIIQQPDLGPKSLIWFASFSLDEEAIEFGRQKWKENFVGKKKRILVLKQLPDNSLIKWANNTELILESQNFKS